MARLTSRPLRRLLGQSDPAMLWSMDFAFLGLLVTATGSFASYARPAALQGDSGSARDRKKRRQLAKLRRKVAALTVKRRNEEYETVMRLARRIGVFAMHVRVVPEGFEAFGGQYLGDRSLAAFIDHLISDLLAFDRVADKYGEPKRALYQRIRQLEREIDQRPVPGSTRRKKRRSP